MPRHKAHGRAPDSGSPASQPATLRTAEDLAQAGLISATERPAVEQVARRYAIAVPAHLADAIAQRPNDDPLRRQFVPAAEELVVAFQ